MEKKKIKFFVSYAHRNSSLATEFIERLRDVLKPSKSYCYEYWQDNKLTVGEKWDNQIQEAVESCDLGLLLISPSFLSSNYITQNELPTFVNGKPCVPIMLAKIDLERHDLKGLEAWQIFRLNRDKFKSPRAYSELKKKRREDFIFELFQAIETKLDDNFKSAA
ncbi:toll/interleukin-1 receptor domain-containing protein [Vibrio diabolicus]|uniref:toll/interleukin-1 receptor domain-containing protein n=1 Tax=Vibrio diabolicus TaxID=50719 RepID=UPI003D7ED22F